MQHPWMNRETWGAVLFTMFV